MKAIFIPNCSKCPHHSHTGAFAKGGAKPMCGHDLAVKARIGRKSGLSNLTIPRYPRTPKWCPLPESNMRMKQSKENMQMKRLEELMKSRR